MRRSVAGSVRDGQVADVTRWRLVAPVGALRAARGRNVPVADVAVIREAVKAFYLHPISLLLVVFLTPALRLIGYLPVQHSGLPLWVEVPLDAVRLALWVWIAIRFSPGFLRWWMVRKIPFAAALFLFFIPVIAANFFLFHMVFFPRGFPLSEELFRFSRLLAFSLIIHVAIVMLTRDAVAACLQVRTEGVPAPEPVPEPASPDLFAHPPAACIDPDLTGEVRAIQAQNQYVLIHAGDRKHLVRMTLRSAMDRMPAGSGRQVHRSWWVSEAELRTGRHDPAAGVIHGSGGIQYPVGGSFRDNLTGNVASGR